MLRRLVFSRKSPTMCALDVRVMQWCTCGLEEKNFSVVLLLTHHASVLRLSYEHDFRLPACNHHQHLGCKISAAERVLSVERQGLEVGHVGVEKNEGNVQLVQLVGELSCDIE